MQVPLWCSSQPLKYQCYSKFSKVFSRSTSFQLYDNIGNKTQPIQSRSLIYIQFFSRHAALWHRKKEGWSFEDI